MLVEWQRDGLQMMSFFTPEVTAEEIKLADAVTAQSRSGRVTVLQFSFCGSPFRFYQSFLPEEDVGG